MSGAINLLPWREARRRQRTRRTCAALSLIMLAGMALGTALTYYYQHLLGDQQQRIELITTQLHHQFGELDSAPEYQTALTERRAQLEQLRRLLAQRNHTVALLNALVERRVDGVVYRDMARHGEQVSFTALASEETAVATQLRRLANAPELIEPVLSEVSNGVSTQQRLFRFQLRQPVSSGGDDEQY